MNSSPRRGGCRHALVLQHHPDEHPGSLRRLLEEMGFCLSTVELDAGEPIPALDAFDVLLVMGGPQQVWEDDEHPWLADERAAIRTWVGALRRPFLGVCLGHQLLADAMGGRVARMPRAEIGVLDVRRTPDGAKDRLFGLLPTVFPGLQWHEAEVVEAPPDSTVLAQSAASPVQAFRVGHCALGVQFHVEVEPDTVSKWAAVPDYARTLALEFGSADTLKRAVAAQLERMTAIAASLARALLEDVTVAGVAP